ncbi:LysE family translocator [Sorangium sp. So ce1335]|uniref:LysE family translocator n=1 Tax=Sorangium sp. So ce1335 TaxID=3133335 RepID=UPI003F63B4AB
MTPGSIVALVGTMLVLAVVPGPSDIAVVARSAGSGLTSALFMVGGIVAADLVFIALAVYSLTALAGAMGGLFDLARYACAAYLVWTGIGLLRARADVVPARETTNAARFSAFLGGFSLTLSDPKAILFYMGLFPAFLDLSRVSLADAVIVTSIATVVVGGVKLGYAYAADRATLFFENSRARRRLNIAAGAVMIGTGVYLLCRGVRPAAIW